MELMQDVHSFMAAKRVHNEQLYFQQKKSLNKLHKN